MSAGKPRLAFLRPAWLVVVAAACAGPALAEEQPAPIDPTDWPTLDGDTVEVSAPLVELDGVEGGAARLKATGGVVLRSGSLELRAPSLDYDGAAGTLKLSGGVRGADGRSIVSAAAIDIDTRRRRLALDSGELRLLDRTTDDAVRTAVGSGAPVPGRTRLTVKARTISRPADGSLEAGDLWLSSCACELPAGPDGRPPCPPLVSASAERARIVPGDVAELHGAWIRLFDVPVLPLPYVPLPLSSRKTGFLFPRLQPAGPGGVTVEQPFFLVLGESMDLTFEPRWSFGNTGASTDGTGVRGPGLATEWRWTPAHDARGSMRVNAMWDTSTRIVGGLTRGERGGRLAIALDDARTVLGGRLVTDLDLVSDATLLRDLAGAQLARARLPYLPSRTAWNLHTGGLGITVDAGLQQRLEPTLASAFPQLRFFGAPALRATAFSAHALGPVTGDAALSGWLETRDPSTMRLHGHLTARQSLPLLRGRGGVLALEAGERADLTSATDLASVGGTGLGGFAGLLGRLHVSKAFGDWVHVVSPSVRLRAHAATPGWTSGWSSTSTGYGSEVESVLPAGTGVQAVAGLSTTLRSGAWVPAKVDLAWHPSIVDPSGTFVLQPGQLRASLSSTPLPDGAAGRLGAAVAWDLRSGGPASVTGRWDGKVGVVQAVVGAGYYAANVDDQLLRPVDLLFSVPSAAAALLSARLQGDAVVSVSPAEGVSIRGSALVSRPFDGGAIAQQYSLAASWEMAGCARLSLSAAWSPNAASIPQVGLGFELGDVAGTIAAAADDLSRR